MSRMPSFCPHCGRVVPAGARCTCRPRPKRRPTRGDKTRAEREPWRSRYSTQEYRRNRQAAIERTKGRCTDCRTVCAWHDGIKWRTAGMGGEVDHIKALSDGGTDDAGNLALRCRSCHKKRDDMRRKAQGRCSTKRVPSDT